MASIPPKNPRHDLETNHRHWFADLATVMGADPIAEKEAGDFSKMTSERLRWERRQ
jgi:hypothetical protein